MEIKTIPISQAIPAPYNPRKMERYELEKLINSIRTFEYVDPIIWNEETGHVVGGNQRLLALQELGFEEIQVVRVKLGLEQEKMLNLALNRISGSWDEKKLAELLRELNEIPDLDISSAGFEVDEMSKLFEKFDMNIGDGFFDSAELPTIPENPITMRGDRIELGPHVVYCGDSSSEVDIVALMNGKQADLCVTDIVYDATFNPENRPTNRKRRAHSGGVLLNDSLGEEKYEVLLRNYIIQLKTLLKPSSPFYLFNGHKNFGKMEDLFTEMGFKVSNVITWVKPCPSPGYGDYQNQSEFILYGWLPGEGGHKWYGNNETNVWDVSREAPQNLVHPTQKPLQLLRRAILNSSQPGEIVYDGFAGGGSTLVASHELGRVCYLMELDPKFCDVIVRRFAKTFGKSEINPEICEKYEL